MAGQRETPTLKNGIGAGGNADLIIAALQRRPDLDDDELAQRAGVAPRQQVNIICRRLERHGVLKTFTGPRGKIVNRLTGAHPTERSPSQAQAPRSAVETAASKVMAFSVSTGSICLGSGTDDTLVIIPCSGRKSEGSEPVGAGGTLLGELPDRLAGRLASARRTVAEIAHLDESTLMPAWHRYTGMLYETARLGLEQAQEAIWFRRLLILSGGYGVVRAIDPIGTYNLALDESRWPRGLLQEVIEAYARRHLFTRFRRKRRRLARTALR